MTNTWNDTIKESKFPDELKKSKVVPLYEKKDLLTKKKYLPVSLLLHVWKVFEQIIYEQMNSYMENKLLKYITGFRKAHGSSKLIVMLEKWKSVLDKKEYVCLFINLSKALDTINHDLLLAKLKAYSFSYKSLTLICSWKQKTEHKLITLIWKKGHLLNLYYLIYL